MRILYITVDMFITLIDEAIAYFKFANIDYSNYMIEDFILNKIRKDGFTKFEIIYDEEEESNNSKTV